MAPENPMAMITKWIANYEQHEQGRKDEEKEMPAVLSMRRPASLV